MSSHTFPKNVEMREKWMTNLILKPYKKTEINKLRVCYKHFKETDYTGSQLRRLIRAAVPHMATEISEKQTSSGYQDRDMRHEEHIDKISKKQEIAIPLQEDVNILSQQQQAQQENITLLQKDVETLYHMQAQIQTQHHDQLQEIVKEVGSLKTQLHLKSQTRRPNLAEVTRKKSLSPTARKFYDNNIKLQAQKRRMKLMIKRIKQQNVNKNVTLERRIDKSQEDKTTKI
ncbi:uncharacterized protein LOC112589192 [Harpegnathos saltator]|uniref:uncharacterized protein LOC112589192 n=1 Tax=Harpegnathos saltator TaxID=610380 RepID=UPI000DBED0D0|nr:uncharacterized protein LOC112589192 [Harpegnathos saltator]